MIITNQQSSQAAAVAEGGGGRGGIEERGKSNRKRQPIQRIHNADARTNTHNHEVECGPQCLNRHDQDIECTESTCNVWNQVMCQNQWLRQLVTTKSRLQVRIASNPKNGQGLFAIETIARGTLVIECAGQVISASECKKRERKHIDMWQRDKPFQSYLIKYAGSERGVQICLDARNFGNESRFANHSCDPNCYMLKRIVDGQTRLFLRTLRQIESHEELTYRYGWPRHDMFACSCGAAQCSGFMN